MDKRHAKTTATRRGATLVLVVLLLAAFMVGIAFSVDLARVQLAQIELQSVADLSARAGAEAIARGVGDGSDNAGADAAIRAEIAMVAELNRVGGGDVVITDANDVTFGYATQSGSSVSFSPTTTGGSFDMATDAVRVHPRLDNFPMFFGAFVGTESLDLSKQAAAIVRERDIVLVLDRSASMLDHDSGTISLAAYSPDLFSLEQDLYSPADGYYYPGGRGDAVRNTEFAISAGTIALSKMQAMKLAVFNFRNAIDLSRGHEKLGLVTYAEFADYPADANPAPGPVNLGAGLSASVRSAIVGDGTTRGDERYAAALEPDTTGYDNFDYNYLGMRWQERTNISDGIRVGAEVLYGSGHRPSAKSILVLMADGRHTQGAVSGIPEDALATALSAHPDMIVFTVSFGANADSDLMRRLAVNGGGQWYHASDFAALDAVFQEIARTAGVTLIE